MIKVDMQIATKDQAIPTDEQFKHWVNEALQDKIDQVEICLRLIDKNESAKLNETYRTKKGPTNILTFPYEIDSSTDEIKLLGDLAICAEIVNEEAIKQHVDQEAHWAHIVIHGCLHLMDYTHNNETNAKEMETEEANILKTLGYDNPYKS